MSASVELSKTDAFAVASAVFSREALDCAGLYGYRGPDGVHLHFSMPQRDNAKGPMLKRQRRYLVGAAEWRGDPAAVAGARQLESQGGRVEVSEGMETLSGILCAEMVTVFIPAHVADAPTQLAA